MSYKVLDRKDQINNDGIKNKWKWAWLEEKNDYGNFYSDYLRKLDAPGLAMC